MINMADSLARLISQPPKAPISQSIIKFCLTNISFKAPIMVKLLVNTFLLRLNYGKKLNPNILRC